MRGFLIDTPAAKKQFTNNMKFSTFMDSLDAADTIQTPLYPSNLTQTGA